MVRNKKVRNKQIRKRKFGTTLPGEKKKNFS